MLLNVSVKSCPFNSLENSNSISYNDVKQGELYVPLVARSAEK